MKNKKLYKAKTANPNGLKKHVPYWVFGELNKTGDSEYPYSIAGCFVETCTISRFSENDKTKCDFFAFGHQLSPILVEIENTIIDHEAGIDSKPCYGIDGFRAATKIFMSALMDMIYELQQRENIDKPDSLNMAEKAGNDLRKLIKIYTNIETRELYKIEN